MQDPTGPRNSATPDPLLRHLRSLVAPVPLSDPWGRPLEPTWELEVMHGGATASVARPRRLHRLAGLLALGGAIWLLVHQLGSREVRGSETMAWVLLGAAIGALVLLNVVFLPVNQRLTVDGHERQVLLVRSWMGLAWRSWTCPFSDLFGLESMPVRLEVQDVTWSSGRWRSALGLALRLTGSWWLGLLWWTSFREVRHEVTAHALVLVTRSGRVYSHIVWRPEPIAAALEALRSVSETRAGSGSRSPATAR